jgi:hypothetical protein
LLHWRQGGLLLIGPAGGVCHWKRRLWREMLLLKLLPLLLPPSYAGAGHLRRVVLLPVLRLRRLLLLVLM